MELLDDVERGTSVCSACGCCAPLCYDVPRLTVAERIARYHTDSKVPNLPSHMPARVRVAFELVSTRVASAPYAHATYLNERIGQWRQREPEIPDADEATIVRLAGHVTTISKEEIRELLNRCDDELRQRNKRPRFVRKYLEKWLTIRYVLTGVASKGKYASISLVHRVQWWFSKIVPVFLELIKGRGRYSILNVNFLFRRIFDIEGVWVRYSIDFPPLKTDAKRAKLVMMWSDLCGMLNIPYINNDQMVFPHVKFYRPSSWVKKFDAAGTSRAKPKLRRSRRRTREERERDTQRALKRLHDFYQY